MIFKPQRRRVRGGISFGKEAPQARNLNMLQVENFVFYELRVPIKQPLRTLRLCG